jgi:hypothetical protein
MILPHVKGVVLEKAQECGVTILSQSRQPISEIIPYAVTRKEFEEMIARNPGIIEEWGEHPPHVWEEGTDDKGNPILFIPGSIEDPPTIHYLPEEEYHFLLAREISILDQTQSLANVFRLFPQRQIAA